MTKKSKISLVLLLIACLLIASTTATLAEAPGEIVTLVKTIDAGVATASYDVTFNYSAGLEFVSITDNIGTAARKTASGSKFGNFTAGATSITVTLKVKIKDDTKTDQEVSFNNVSYFVGLEKKPVADTVKTIKIEVPINWSEWEVKTPATCEKDGEKTRFNKDNPAEIDTQKIPALGHDYQPGKILEEATCTKVGKQEFVCKNDPTHKEIRDIPMLEHKASEWEIVVAPDPEKKLDGKRVKRCLVGGEVLVEEVIPYVTTIYFPNNTASTQGLRFRDMKPELGRKWFMFTPVDLSADGEQIIPIIASNAYYVGKAMVNVADGAVTVTYEFPKAVKVKSEFLTLFADLASVSTVNPAELAEQAFTFGEPINIEEALGGDTKVLLYTNFVIDYNDSIRGVTRFFTGNKDYRAAVAAMKELMD